MKIYPLIILLFLYSWISAQQPITLTEQTLRIGMNKSEEIWFGFAAGDQLIFNFEEVGKKELKEVSIIEYPSSTKFADFKINKIENKIIDAAKSGIYKFRFYNSSLSGRLCKIKIQRKPASEATTLFNTEVRWIMKQDTTWNSFTKEVVVGYDTTYEQKLKRELIKTEQAEEMIMDKNERVHSITNGNGNKTFLFFALPSNQTGSLVERKVIAWAFWIGVGEEANLAWKDNVNAISALAKGVAGTFTSPLGALAIGKITKLALPELGEDVGYSITREYDKQLFMAGQQYKGYDHGKGVAGYKKFTEPLLCQGKFYLCMYNDNMMLGINATIKVVAIIETKTYRDIPYNEEKITPRYEKKIFKEPVLTTSKVPILSQE